MCQKTKLLAEKKCNVCKNDFHIIYFRFIEGGLVYYFSKCTSCKYSYRSNATFKVWKKLQSESASLNQPSKHHRLPKSKNGANNPANISIVPQKKHEAWHTLWKNKDVEEIVREMNALWIPPNVKLLITYIN